MSQFDYQNGQYALKGHVTLSEVALLHKTLKSQWLKGEGDITVDLSAVDKADSSILALLLEWKSEAIKHNRKLVILSLPEALKVLSEMSGIDKLL